MKRIAVIYQSKYGTTKQYAEWIADELNADLYERSNANPGLLDSYEVIIFGGGLYAGGISGIQLVTKNACKCLVVFTVGLADPKSTDYSDILNKNFNEKQLKSTRIFHLRGGIDYKKLGIVHKGMMAMLKKFMLDTKPIAERTEDDTLMLETYGDKIYFTDKSTIIPIIEYINAL